MMTIIIIMVMMIMIMPHCYHHHHQFRFFLALLTQTIKKRITFISRKYHYYCGNQPQFQKQVQHNDKKKIISTNILPKKRMYWRTTKNISTCNGYNISIITTKIYILIWERCGLFRCSLSEMGTMIAHHTWKSDRRQQRAVISRMYDMWGE